MMKQKTKKMNKKSKINSISKIGKKSNTKKKSEKNQIWLTKKYLIITIN